MTSHASEPNRGPSLPPTTSESLENPLDFIQEDHQREREICETLEDLAGSTVPDEHQVTRVLSFLGEGLPLHLEDEELDLFPLVRRRCEPEDEIERAIERLSQDHRHTTADISDVVAVLRELGREGKEITGDERSVLSRYAANTRRHLMLENAVILPFARLRLTAADLETLRLRMLQRRGLDRSS